MIKITENDNVHLQWYEDAKKQTLETLPEFIRHLIKDYKHDYGTICHAIASASIATALAIDHSPQGGISGFQGGAVMWEFIRNWDHSLKDKPLRLINYETMLYPQFEQNYDKNISKSTWEWLQEKAMNLLNENRGVDVVKEHWQSIVDGKVPFGYTVRED
jgi:hypothetical protein